MERTILRKHLVRVSVLHRGAGMLLLSKLDGWKDVIRVLVTAPFIRPDRVPSPVNREPDLPRRPTREEPLGKKLSPLSLKPEDSHVSEWG